MSNPEIKGICIAGYVKNKPVALWPDVKGFSETANEDDGKITVRFTEGGDSYEYQGFPESTLKEIHGKGVDVEIFKHVSLSTAEMLASRFGMGMEAESEEDEEDEDEVEDVDDFLQRLAGLDIHSYGGGRCGTGLGSCGGSSYSCGWGGGCGGGGHC